MMKNVFEIKDLAHGYQGKIAIRADSFSIKSASITGLTGPNGSGKTTLLKILALMEKPVKGRVMFMGKPAGPFSQWARRRVTLLTQEPFLLKRSVFNNVAYGLKIRKDTTDLGSRVKEALESVGLSAKEFSDRKWNELSGGEAQRVALAARLILKPRVLLLDEPTANVDAQSNRLIRKAVVRAREVLGTTLVIASHDLEWLCDISDHVLSLFQGRIFKGGRINIIFGPWEKHKNGFYKKTGTGHFNLVIPKPPRVDSAILLPADAIELCLDKNEIPENNAYIQGVLTDLSLDRKTGMIFATMRAGDLSLISGLGEIVLRKESIHPGRIVYIHYSPMMVKFPS